MHAAVILAAGGSRRLGEPKQLLCVGGKTLLRHVIDCVAATAAAPILVVLGADSAAMRAVVDAVDIPGLRSVVNPEWEEGLASSLRRAAAELADWPGSTLIVGCDQPRLTAAHLRALVDRARRQPSRDIASRYLKVTGIPVMVRASTLSQAATLRGDHGLRTLIRDDALVVDAEELAFDIDTPADARAAIEAGWIDRPR